MKRKLSVVIMALAAVMMLVVSCGEDPFFHEISLRYDDKVVETVIVQDGEEYTLPDKAGDVTGITGWIYNDKEYKAGEKITVTGDTTITAVGGTETSGGEGGGTDGGSGTGSSDITVIYKMTGKEDEKITGDPATMKTWKPDWEKSSYEFDGWYTEDNGGGTYYAVDAAITKSETLYAHWIDGNLAFDNGKVKIKDSSKDTAVSVVIPAVYQGKTVTSIASCGFQDCSKLETVTFEKPENITDIPSTAFAGCGKLSSIDLSKTRIEYVSGYTFNDCTSLATVVLPTTVTSIENNAFGYCTSLKSIDIPASVTEIDEAAFYSCTNLKDISINNTTSLAGSPWGATSATVVYYTGKVIFDSDGGSDVASVYPDESTKKVKAPTAPTREGYVFYGWYKADGTYFDFDTEVTEVVRLKAKWGMKYSIGDPGPAGGIIFYVANEPQISTYVDSEGKTVKYTWIYLEAASADLTDTYKWCSKTDNGDYNTDEGIGKGKSNTEKLLAVEGKSFPAAKACAEYGNGTQYDDWFLPSADEFKELYTNLYTQGKGGTWTNGHYWTSSESKDSYSAYKYIITYSGNPKWTDDRSQSWAVRPCRQF